MRSSAHWVGQHRAWQALVLITAVCSHASPGFARTWHVEKDGSGDFTAIQPAIDAAAAGDVIEIGPGRYTENSPFSPYPDSWVEPTYVAVTKEDLTIRGTDRDAVIIGPPTPTFVGFGPKGIATHGEIRRLRVESLTVENVHDGMYLGTDESVVVSGCLLRGCDIGILGVDDVHPLIEQCEFLGCREGATLWTARNGEVVDCTFANLSAGVIYISSSNAAVRRCRIDGGIGGVQYQDSDGLVEGCTILNPQNFSITVTDPGGMLVVHDNRCTGGGVGLSAGFGARISGNQNLITGTTYAGIRFRVNATCDLHFNDVLRASGYAVRAESYLGAPFMLDLTENYWGVETAAEISALILDGNDDPTVNAIVDFEPFSVHSVPNTEKSFGGLKAPYGGGGQ